MENNTQLLPLEIIEHIINYLSINDRITCLLICKAWHAYLYRTVIRNVTFYTRREIASFLSYIRKYKDLGKDVREIHFKLRVGLTSAEFTFICQQCPLLEVYRFTCWHSYKLNSFSTLPHLKQIPKLFDEKKGLDALTTSGQTLTRLELSELLLRKLIPRQEHLTILQWTPHLTHLKLDGVFSLDPDENDGRRMDFNHVDWNLIHQHCKHLTYINMTQANFTATSVEAKNMQSVTHIAFNMKHLILKTIYLSNPVWLHYLAFMYPNLIELELDFSMGCFVTLTDSRNRLDTTECQTGFLILAHELKSLKRLTLKGLRRSHFAGMFFFKMLVNKGIQLDYASIAYDTNDFSPAGMNIYTFDALIYGQYKTIKTLEIDMWDGAYEDAFKFIIEPLSLCTQLTRLSLRNEDFTGYYYNAVPLDLMLDTCSNLTELSLIRVALCIEERSSVKRLHSLQKLELQASRISQPLFEYLTVRCPKITYMTLISCSWMPREIEMKINMPNNMFEFIRVADMNRRKTTALEGNLIQGHTVNIFSITQLDKIKVKKERYKKIDNKITPPDTLLSTWYHLYEPPPLRRVFIPSFVRRLREKEVMTCFYLTEYFKDNQHLSKARNFHELETRYLSKKNWKFDIASGYVHITCKSIHTLKYNFNVITYK